jgi:hypothetical protein
MQAVMRVWAKTTLREREAFHQFSCRNSKDPEVLRIVQTLNELMAKEIKAVHVCKGHEA